MAFTAIYYHSVLEHDNHPPAVTMADFDDDEDLLSTLLLAGALRPVVGPMSARAYPFLRRFQGAATATASYRQQYLTLHIT